jgi:hypothetical protein
MPQPFQGCENNLFMTAAQGFKANPGLEFANAFSVIQNHQRFQRYSKPPTCFSVIHNVTTNALQWHW